jgi:hypothetical protein
MSGVRRAMSARRWVRSCPAPSNVRRLEEGMRRALALLSSVLVSTLCLADRQPTPNRTEYLLSVGAGFQLSEENGVTYGMSYKVIKPLPAQVFCVAMFANPEDPDIPLTKELAVPADAKEIQVQSPAIHSIQNDRRYLVRLTLYLDAEHTKMLTQHDQAVLFQIPADMLQLVRDRYRLTVQ